MTESIVRAPSRGELQRAAEIMQIAFATETIEPWLGSCQFLADNHGLEYIIVVEAEGKLVSSLLCTPTSAFFGSDRIPLCGVGAVATLPDHRQHGYAGIMMHESVRTLYRNGHHTSALWPFSFRYYRKFGWELAGETRRITVPSEIAKELASPDGVRPMNESDIPEISRLVERKASRYNCTAVRDELWWKCTYATHKFQFEGEVDQRERRRPIVHETDGKIDGYALYVYVGEGEETAASIRDMFTDNGHARLAILSAIAATNVKSVNFCAPIDDGFFCELPEPRKATCALEPGFQFRVVNPLAALEMRSILPDVKGRLSFEITDTTLDKSEFTIEFAEGKITRANSGASERLIMDIQAFSQLYNGYMRPAQSAAMGKLQASSAKAIEIAEELFPKTLPFRPWVEVG